MPDLYIEAEDYAFVKAAVKKAGFREVGGLGIIEVDEDGRPIVNHMRLLKQEISSGEVDWHDDAHPDYLEWLYTPEAEGGAGFEGTSYGLYSWHSHGSMGVFWSGTDEDFIEKVGRSVPYVFSSVFNNKGDVKHRLDVFGKVTDDCPLVDIAHVVWDDKKSNLFVLDHVVAEPFLEQLDKTEKEYTEIIKSLQAERDEALKEIRENLATATKDVYKLCEDRMEEDWAENVTTATYSGFSGNQGNGSKTSTKGSGGGQRGKGNGAGGTANGSGHNQRAIAALNPAPDDIKDDEDIRTMCWYQCYDSEVNIEIVHCLKTIINDMSLVILDDIPDEVLAELTEAERHMLAARQQPSDIADELAITRNLFPHLYM